MSAAVGPWMCRWFGHAWFELFHPSGHFPKVCTRAGCSVIDPAGLSPDEVDYAFRRAKAWFDRNYPR